MTLADPLPVDAPALPRIPSAEPLPRLESLASLGQGLSRRLAQCRRRGGQLALLWLEVEVREAPPVQPPDANAEGLLRIAGQRLRNRVREVDEVVRIGEHGFAVVLAAVGSAEMPAVERRLLHALQGSYSVDGDPWRLGVHLGSAVFPESGRQGTELAEAARRQLLARRAGSATGPTA